MFVFSDDDDDDDDEDDTEALLAELEQIKKERAEDKLRKVSIFLPHQAPLTRITNLAGSVLLFRGE